MPDRPANMGTPVRDSAVLLNPFWPFSTANVLSLKATVLLLLTLLIKARVQIGAGSAIGIFFVADAGVPGHQRWLGDGSRWGRPLCHAAAPLIHLIDAGQAPP